MTYLEWQKVGQGVTYMELRDVRLAAFGRNPRGLAVHIREEIEKSY
jgi:hypothetical protein